MSTRFCFFGLSSSSRTHLATIYRLNPDYKVFLVTSHGHAINKLPSNVRLLSRSEYSSISPPSDITLISSATHDHISDCLLASSHSKHIVIDKPVANEFHKTKYFIDHLSYSLPPINIFYQKRLAHSSLLLRDFIQDKSPSIEYISLDIFKYKPNSKINQLLNFGIHYLDIILFLLKPTFVRLSSFSSTSSINKFSANLMLDSYPLEFRFNTLDKSPPRIKLKIITTEHRITLTEDTLSISSLCSSDQPSITNTKLSSYNNFWTLFLSNSDITCLPTLLDAFNSELLADALLTSISLQQSFTVKMRTNL